LATDKASRLRRSSLLQAAGERLEDHQAELLTMPVGLTIRGSVNLMRKVRAIIAKIRTSFVRANGAPMQTDSEMRSNQITQ
jgi:hypothetical protein